MRQVELKSYRLTGLLAMFFVSAPLSAQPFDIPWTGLGADNNWVTESNWDYSAFDPPPPADAVPTGAFEENAIIANGDTVVIDSDLATLTNGNGPPGGLTASNGSVLSIEGAGVFSTNSTQPTVDGSVEFVSGATLAVTGPAASFSSDSLSFTGGGYSPTITGVTHGLISVAGDLTLTGGTFTPTFSGYSPTGSETWTLADAAQISGEFTIDNSALSTTPGVSANLSVVAGGVNGSQLVMGLSTVLSLNVNVDNGTAEIVSESGQTIDIIGYGIASAAGGLAPNGWNSLADQAVAGWNEAGVSSTTNLDEIAGPVGASVGDASITATATTIGSPAIVQPFGSAAVTDYTFEYVTDAGEIIEGLVNVSGLNQVNNLLLTVDPSTGEVVLSNSSSSTLNLRGYTISSESGSLQPANGSWNSLADQGVTGAQEANPTANFVSELVAESSDAIVLTPGQSYSLGDLFDEAGTADLELEFLLTSNAVVGDYNGDGTVDAADYTVWRDNLGADGSLLPNRDPANAGVIGAADYTSWQTNFGLSSGQLEVWDGVVSYEAISGSAGLASVPEPTAASLLLISTLLIGSRIRRSH